MTWKKATELRLTSPAIYISGRARIKLNFYLRDRSSTLMRYPSCSSDLANKLINDVRYFQLIWNGPVDKSLL